MDHSFALRHITLNFLVILCSDPKLANVVGEYLNAENIFDKLMVLKSQESGRSPKACECQEELLNLVEMRWRTP